MAMDPEKLHLLLVQLIAEFPTLEGTGLVPPDVFRWLGRAAQLVEQQRDGYDMALLKVASANLRGVTGAKNAGEIAAIVYRALARAEAAVPSAARGGVIGAGEAFSAVQVIGRVLSEARQDVLIVDPYLDGKALTDFAVLASTGVAIQLLGDEFTTKSAALSPFVARWMQEHGASRPLQVRLSQPRALHDRLIILDSKMVYTVSQSLKDLAARSPALVHPVDANMAAMKVGHYQAVWAAGAPVT